MVTNVPALSDELIMINEGSGSWVLKPNPRAIASRSGSVWALPNLEAVAILSGSSSSFSTWAHTSAPCNVQSWGKNQWHHIQLAYSRNETGWITYKSATVDGVSHPINRTVLGAFMLGWRPTLLVNVQLDGATSGSGSAELIMDNLTIHRW